MQTLAESTEKESQKAESASDILGINNKLFDESAGLSLSEVEYIVHKVSSNWNTTYFTENGEMQNMNVDLKVRLAQSGVIEDVVITKRNGSSAQYNLFVDSAIMAVKRSSPLDQLPVESYERWHEIILTFDPQGITY